MNRVYFLVVLFFLSVQVFAQNEISVRREVKRIDVVSIDKLYNKKTGKLVSKKEFERLVRNNPNLPIEREYDNKGNVVKYLYDPDNVNSFFLNNDGSEKVRKGEYFPELVLQTIDGKILKIKDLKGKMVIVRFEKEADTFRFKKYEIEELDVAINQTQRKSEIEAIIIFDASKKQIQKGFDLIDSNFELIPNGYGFHRKLNIISFPSTIILDKEGRLMEEFNWSDEIDILDMLNKS